MSQERYELQVEYEGPAGCYTHRSNSFERQRLLDEGRRCLDSNPEAKRFHLLTWRERDGTHYKTRVHSEARWTDTARP